jgi:glycosyltransferase involved in cell wall biosynthesis
LENNFGFRTTFNVWYCACKTDCIKKVDDVLLLIADWLVLVLRNQGAKQDAGIREETFCLISNTKALKVWDKKIFLSLYAIKMTYILYHTITSVHMNSHD